MSKDALFLLTPVLFENALMQVMYVTTVLLPYVVLVVRYQPYKVRIGTQLDACIHSMIVFLTLFGGLLDGHGAGSSVAAQSDTPQGFFHKDTGHFLSHQRCTYIVQLFDARLVQHT